MSRTTYVEFMFSDDKPVASEPEIESSSLYSNVVDETERQPIPVSRFSEFMTRVRTYNFDRLIKQFQVWEIVFSI